MKIGKVAKKYDLSNDTLHYYINYGLLVPPKINTQYDFDAQTLADLERILELKALSFSLKEIHRIISLNRISGFQSFEDTNELIEIYQNKKDERIQELGLEEKRISTLNEKIVTLRFNISKPTPSKGVPVNMLHLLCCPDCSSELEILNAKMDASSIESADLTCHCGYKARIDKGILITENKANSIYDKPDINRELYKDLPSSLISLFQKSYNHMISHIQYLDLKNKVVLETYVNAYFFMHNHIEYLDPNAKYIVVDKYPETLLMYKKLIEDSGSNLIILYIADSSLNLPIKKNSVDLNLDFFATNEHQFYKHSFLPIELKPYMKPNGNCLGTYFYFANGFKSMKNLINLYPESDVHNFSRPHFFDSIKEGTIELTDWQEIGKVTDSGNNLGFGFHEKDEDMHLLTYLGIVHK